MKKTLKCAVAVSLTCLLTGTTASAQLFKGLENTLKKAVNEVTNTVTESATGAVKTATDNSSTGAQNSGVVYYVSTAGSGRANGLSPETPMKDIQKALNAIADAGHSCGAHSIPHI